MAPEEVVRPESPSRRRLFAALGAAASAVITAVVGVPLAALGLAPLRKRAAGAAGSAVDLGPAASFDGVKSGSHGPLEVTFERKLMDGYMTRMARQRVVVVPDPASPTGLAILDTTCSHLGCGVAWNAERKAFLCPCHGGVYDVAGKVIGGPPPRPLARLPLVVEGGRLRLDAEKLA